MKLDNRGWGYRDMIIYSSIIIICLIIVVFFSRIMYNNLENNVNASSSSKESAEKEVKKESNVITLTNEQLTYYHTKEKELQKATYDYLEKNNYQETSAIRKIDLDILEGFGYVNKVTDVLDGSLCEGYGKINTKDSSYIVTPYIKCKHYVTNSYGE